MKKISRYLIIAGVLGFASLIGVIGLYFFKFHGELSSEHQAWAAFGGYIGGTAGTLLACLSLFALLYTIHVQAQELASTWEQLKKSAVAHSLHADTVQLQALLALREHYLSQSMEKMSRLEEVGASGTATTLVEQQLADFDTKLREVNKALALAHERVVGRDAA